MAIFIDPRGNPTFGVGICDRCRRKLPLHMLHPDPNSPGLRVCDMDRDDFDPYRLPARQTERINLPFVRPDVPLDGVHDPFVIPEYLITQGFDPYITEGGDLLVPEP